jgi:hypothetical protein
MKSTYQYGEWYHKINITRDFPTIVKQTEIHQLPKTESTHGYILCHFVDQECHWIRFYSEKEEAQRVFNLKKEEQLKKEIPIHQMYLTHNNDTQFMSSLYNVYPSVCYPKEGDRWIMQYVEIT